MTAAQAAMVERALTRAEAQGVRVVWQGVRRSDGARVLVVNSGTEENKYYPVAVLGARLACECRAAKQGNYCQHRAAAHRFLADEARNKPITIWK